jgi:hypothetical protein
LSKSGNGKKLLGVIWQTAMIRNFELLGVFIGLDMMKGVINALLWPYFQLLCMANFQKFSINVQSPDFPFHLNVFCNIKSIVYDQKIYIMCNDDSVGKVILINELHKHWSSNQHKNQVKRNGAVTIHLIAACLMQDHQGFTVRYLSAWKNLKEKDQSNNTSGGDAIPDTCSDPSLAIERSPKIRWILRMSTQTNPSIHISMQMSHARHLDVQN